MGEGWEIQPEQSAPSSVTGNEDVAAASISVQGWPKSQEKIKCQFSIVSSAAGLTNT